MNFELVLQTTRSSIIFWFTLLSTSGFSQSFHGIIRDQSTKEPLPYANIGVRNKNVGGITDHAGAFQVDLSRAFGTDTLVISYIGYVSYTIPVSTLALNQSNVIDLTPTARVLKEVVIRSKPEVIIVGNKSKSSKHTGWGDFTSSRGRAIGLLINTPDQSVKVNALFFHVDACEFDSVRVRINFLKLEAGTIKPVESQNQNIFLTIAKRKGWMEVPIQEDLVFRKEQVIVAIEWVDAWAKPRTLEEGGSYMFTLSLAKAPGSHYLRQTPEEPLQLMTSEFTPSIYLASVAIED